MVLSERRISNQHCRVTLGWQRSTSSSSNAQLPTVQSWKDGDGEPQVWLEDLGSSNGTFVRGLLASLSVLMLASGQRPQIGETILAQAWR